MASLREGMRVVTERFGAGMITRVTGSGALVLLDKMPARPIQLPMSELSAEDTEDALIEFIEPTRRELVKTARMTAYQQAARRSIEALRFGVVPSASVEELTVGFDELQDWVGKQLPTAGDSTARVCEVCGVFGSGKSHTMAAIRLIAQEAGFVIAHVEVNGADVSLSDPEGVLRQLLPTATGEDLESATPLLDLHVAAIENGYDQVCSALVGYDRVLANIGTIVALRRRNCLEQHAEDIDAFLSCSDALTTSQLQNQVYADIVQRGGNWRSDPFALKRLIGLATAERPSDFVCCLLAYTALAKRAGFKGMVITIDEFEVEYHLTYTKLERVKGLLRAMRDEMAGAEAPLAIFIATVGQEGHAGDAFVSMLVEASGGAEYDLEEWSPGMLRKLAENIHCLYETAYRLDAGFDKKQVSSVERLLDDDDVAESGHVRAFIKGYVASLDVQYGPGRG